MRSLKAEFETKSQNFYKEKERFDSEIKKIITQNEKQNNKIKILELKEKIKKLIEDRQNTTAYEYCTVALELSPDDLSLLTTKAILQCRLNNFSDAVENFELICKMDPKNSAYTRNYIEALYFVNKLEKAKEVMEAFPGLFEEKMADVLKLFIVIENYFSQDEKEYKNYAITQIDFADLESTKKHISGWGLLEAQYFAQYQPASNKKIICQNLIWYLDGIINGKTLCERLKIDITKKEA